MNILHITTYLQGGAGKIIKDIASYQKRNGNKVFVVTTNKEEPGYCNYKEYIDYFQNNGIKCFKIDSTFKRDIYLNLNVADEVRKIIASYDIDIIHAHAAVPAMVGILARSGMKKYIPVIQTMHGWGTNKRPEHEKMDVTILNSLDKVISVSKSDKKLMAAKGVFEERISTIYNGIEACSEIQDSNDEVIEDIKRHRRNGCKIIGCIGSVCARKNQELLIEALNKISKKEKVFVAFIGEGDKIVELQKKVNKYGLQDNVRFYGYRENANKYIRYFDYFIFTSMSEGFSIALLEGFRAKVPIVVSDIPAFSECVEDKVTGYLFKSNDSDSLKNVIESVVLSHNNHNSIVENAYLTFTEKFTMEKMMAEYKKLYGSFVNIKAL